MLASLGGLAECVSDVQKNEHHTSRDPISLVQALTDCTLPFDAFDFVQS